jgi:hypothetical protein
MPAGYLQIPDWFSAENAGGGVAIADLDGIGKQDLVVFMVDNGPGQNRGLFRVGRDLDAAGMVTAGYTPWIDVPDWFSFENQHGSIAHPVSVKDVRSVNSDRGSIIGIVQMPAGNRDEDEILIDDVNAGKGYRYRYASNVVNAVFGKFVGLLASSVWRATSHTALSRRSLSFFIRCSILNR